MPKVGKREQKIMLKMARKKIDTIKKEIENGDIMPMDFSKFKGNQMKYSNPKELVQLVEEYIEECKQSGEVLTIAGLALKIGNDTGELRSYKKNDDYKRIIEYYKTNILAQQEQLMFKDSKMLGSVKYYLENNFPDKYSTKTTSDVNITGSISLVQLNREAEKIINATIVEGSIVE